MGGKPKFPLWCGPTKGRLAEDVVYQAMRDKAAAAPQGFLGWLRVSLEGKFPLPAIRLRKGHRLSCCLCSAPNTEARQTDERGQAGQTGPEGGTGLPGFACTVSPTLPALAQLRPCSGPGCSQWDLRRFRPDTTLSVGSRLPGVLARKGICSTGMCFSFSARRIWSRQLFEEHARRSTRFDCEVAFTLSFGYDTTLKHDREDRCKYRVLRVLRTERPF